MPTKTTSLGLVLSQLLLLAPLRGQAGPVSSTEGETTQYMKEGAQVTGLLWAEAEVPI